MASSESHPKQALCFLATTTQLSKNASILCWKHSRLLLHCFLSLLFVSMSLNGKKDFGQALFFQVMCWNSRKGNNIWEAHREHKMCQRPALPPVLFVLTSYDSYFLPSSCLPHSPYFSLQLWRGSRISEVRELASPAAPPRNSEVWPKSVLIKVGEINKG